MSKVDSSLTCKILDWDSEFFGFKIGKILKNKLDSHDISEISEWSEKNKINCLYFLSDPSCYLTNNLILQEQYSLVDLRLTFSIDLKKYVVNREKSNTYLVRKAVKNDIQYMQNIAGNSHTDSRFYFDKNFPNEICTKFYQKWICNSFEGYADAVYVACLDNQVVGYITCHIKNNIGNIGLIAVKKNVRGMNIGKLLVESALDWFFESNIFNVNVVTQGRNIASQRLYIKCNFKPESVMLWYHKWYH